MLYNLIIAPSYNGAYHMLPLGLKAYEKLTRLIDEEMEAIGGEKMSMTTLAPDKLWKRTGRWDSAGAELFTLTDRHKNQFCLSPTHEELITKFVGDHRILSYRNLPLRFYQITRKFRDEIAPRKGMLRSREFEMKDMYTFDTNEETALATYETVCQAYNKIFDRIGVEYIKASGSSGIIGGDLSHEYHYKADVGQDHVLQCKRCGVAMNKELAEENGSLAKSCELPGELCELQEFRAIEVGHAFHLGNKYSSSLNACYQDSETISHECNMGCFGLGTTRIMQAALEVLSSETNLRWPSIIAPYQVCIIPKKDGTRADEYMALAEKVSDALTMRPHLRKEVVIDNRMTLSIGRRQVDCERLGYPFILIVGKKALEETPAQYELIDTHNGSTMFLSFDQLCDYMDNVETI